jgi:lipopolysaccharide/colanic/teichoic acid biosynthesis glycosyltransferase
MYRRRLKRLLDVGASVLLLPVLLLLVVLLGPLIYLTDRGSIFYLSQRLGQDGQLFQMIKFRSMKMNTTHRFAEDGTTISGENDPRVTVIGRFLRKTSLDEVPQLINVLKGEMSIIGPRPDLPEDLARYSEVERGKLAVRPGITGYSQAKFRNAINQAEKVSNDLTYINKLSLGLDLKILFWTVETVMKRKNIYAGEEES